MKKIWHMKVDFDFIHNFGCLKKLKFRLLSLHWMQPRKRKEKVNLKERRRMPVKKIWNLREERPCTMSLRNCVWRQWVERWESENVIYLFIFYFFFLFRSGMYLRAETAKFCQYSRYFFPVQNKGGICTGLLVGMVYTGHTGRYGTKLTSLNQSPSERWNKWMKLI